MSNPPRFSAFVQDYNGLTRDIVTDAYISEPISGNINPGDSRIHKVKALWDTGATLSCITPRVVQSLNLRSLIASVPVIHGGGKSMCDSYLVDLYLPNNVRIVGVQVTESNDQTGRNLDGQIRFDIIIGMDVITLGDFAITNKDNLTSFTFQTPSSHRFNFVKELIESDKSRFNQGRNKPCGCGSGRKFKDCHGKL